MQQETLDSVALVRVTLKGNEMVLLMRILPVDDQHTRVAVDDDPCHPYLSALQHAAKAAAHTGKAMVVYLPIAVVEPEIITNTTFLPQPHQ